jgi:mRNA-degrading endonuclease RelE of RelBE toxin-antitoxin system
VARETLETLRVDRESGAGHEEVSINEGADNEWSSEEPFTTQPVRVTEFPRKFQETLRELPRAVARTAVVLAARLAAGEAAAFRGTKRLRRNREIWRQRVGSDYRLLFRLHPDTLEVVDLVNRRDLERRIKSLMGSVS